MSDLELDEVGIRGEAYTTSFKVIKLVPHSFPVVKTENMLVDSTTFKSERTLDDLVEFVSTSKS